MRQRYAKLTGIGLVGPRWLQDQAKIPPLRGQRSKPERTEKLAALVEMTWSQGCSACSKLD